MTSLLSEIRLLQYASIIGRLLACVERNLNFAIPRQGFIDQAHGFAVDGTSLTRPSQISEGFCSIRDVEYGDLDAAIEMDRKQRIRRHNHFLTATEDRNSRNSKAYPQGLKVTDSDFIAHGCAARHGCELPGHPTKVDTASGPSPNLAIRRKEGGL